MLRSLLLPPTGQLWLKGRSIPLDACLAYEDVIDWLKEMAENPPEKVIFNIWLSQHNDGASKFLVHSINALIKQGINIEIKWYYEEEDEDSLHLGECFFSFLKIPFRFIEVEEDF